MAKHLGADLINQISWFSHPSTEEEISIFLDPAHMLKLVRNTIGDWGMLYDAEDNPIEWKYFKNLVTLQENNKIHLATKIRQRHINYFKEKMKVRLAAQVFSFSVADAILYCKTKDIEGFNNCDATITFCRNINDIFDFLNTRNFLCKLPHKKPLYIEHYEEMTNFINSSIRYLETLQDRYHLPILKSPRKTGFNGLITRLKSMGRLFDNVIKTRQLTFLISYKISQDHIEMLFSAIRSRGGFNNNPTAGQFEATYKKLVHSELSISENANCLLQDSTTILHVTSSKKKLENNFLDILCVEEEESFLDDSGEQNIEPEEFNIYKEDVIQHIAGFVVRQLSKIINCSVCCSALEDRYMHHTLIDIKK